MKNRTYLLLTIIITIAAAVIIIKFGINKEEKTIEQKETIYETSFELEEGNTEAQTTGISTELQTRINDTFLEEKETKTSSIETKNN